MREEKNQRVGIVGLGYVGFPLAILCASKGYEVYGFDNDEKKTGRIEEGENIVGEDYLEKLIPKGKINIIREKEEIRKIDISIVCVPTPVNKKHYPDLSFVESACRLIAENLKRGSLVIIESTVNPGVCEEVVCPIFEKSGHKVGKDVFISHCPERINPGDSKWNVTNIPRVVGSFDETGLEKTLNFYRSIIGAEIMPMKTIREAEAAKIIENSFRDINIAFVNELAKSFDLMGIDIVNVLRGASTKPFAFMAHWPSCGVGGHCIPVDPYYLIEKAKELNFDHKFLRMAREINNSMPLFAVELLQDALNQIEKAFKNTSVGVLGVSYKAGIGDLRESPALEIIELLKKRKAVVHVFDPHVPQKSTVKSADEILKKSEVLLVATNHREFVEIPAEEYAKKGIRAVIDGKNCLDKEKIIKSGVIYRGIGR